LILRAIEFMATRLYRPI